MIYIDYAAMTVISHSSCCVTIEISETVTV